MEKLDELYIRAGEVIHFHGMPVVLPSDTRVLCNEQNFSHGVDRFIYPKEEAKTK